MGMVTGYTATKMQEILNQTIKSIAIVGNNLIATKYDDTTVNLGPAKGPKGDIGLTGDVNLTQLNAAITASEDTAGKGLVGFDEVGTEQTWAFLPDVFQEITGISVTFNQVYGRAYRLEWGVLMSSAAENVDFNVECRSGSTVFGRSSAFGKNDGRSYQVGGSKTYEADLTVTRTLKLWARGDNATNMYVKSDYVKSWLAVTDLGTLSIGS